LIYQSEKEEHSALDIEIPLSCIDKVTLSPWLNRALSRELSRQLRSIRGCSGLRIARSTLVNNEEWMSLGESAAAQRAAGQSRS